MSRAPLAGLGVLVTRPAAQSAELVQAIEAAGGSVHSYPVIDIVARDRAELAAAAAELQAADIVVFVSANAVRCGFDAVQSQGARIAAIGAATATAIVDAGGTVDIVPAGGADSEHLLANAEMRDVDGKVITIVRGQSGRELLAKTLAERGARVQYLSAYERHARDIPEDERDRLEQAWQRGDVGAVIVMSVASLEALLGSLPPNCLDRLPDTPLVGPGERVIQTALQRLPGATCVQSPGPGAADLVAALTTVLHQDPDPEND